MKLTLPAALALGFTIAVSASAADAKKKTVRKMPSTIPTPAKMIVVPAPADSAIASGQPPKLISSEMSGQDLQFFTTTVEAGRFQAYLVDLLKTKAQSDQIKALAGALAGTQEQENKQIARLAATKGWTVSTEPTAAQKAMGGELEKVAGPEFDKAAMDKMAAATQEAVAAYETAAQSADKDIKDFSEQMLPLAKEKLRLVDRMTGAGKAAGQLFRTGAPPKPVPGATPKAESGTTPPAITPSKSKAGATPPAKPLSAPVATPPLSDVRPASPKPIPPPITN